jgi:hypothetical protein
MAQASSGRPEMTVLCWNILWLNFNTGGGDAGDRSNLANVIVNEMHADVAGFQECMSEDELAWGLDGRMLKAPGTDNFNCIFYKPGVVEFLGESGRRYLGDYARDAYSQRYVSYAKLRFSGVEFWLFSTHWCLNNGCTGSEGGEKHKYSAQVICDLREELGGDLPAIITADTNSHMDGVLDDDGVRWLLDHGWTLAHQGAWAFDMIFVSNGDWNIGEKVQGPTWPSDHPSLSVKLSPVATGGLAASASPETLPPVMAAAHGLASSSGSGGSSNTSLNTTSSSGGSSSSGSSGSSSSGSSGSSSTTATTAATEEPATTTVTTTAIDATTAETTVTTKTTTMKTSTRSTARRTKTTTTATSSTSSTTTAIPWHEIPAADSGYTGDENGTSWEYFEGYNCYPGYGAADIPGQSGKSHLDGTYNIQECRVECENEPSCHGIVMVRSLPKYLCWLRKDVTLSECVENSAYDFWLLERRAQ